MRRKTLWPMHSAAPFLPSLLEYPRSISTSLCNRCRFARDERHHRQLGLLPDLCVCALKDLRGAQWGQNDISVWLENTGLPRHRPASFSLSRASSTVRQSETTNYGLAKGTAVIEFTKFPPGMRMGRRAFFPVLVAKLHSGQS